MIDCCLIGTSFHCLRVAAFEIANDKVRLADLAQRAGLPVPPLVDLADAAENNAWRLPYPVLLKPRSGFGGSGIVAFETPRKLSEQLAGMTSKQNYFVQSLIEGRDVSCGVYCHDGNVLASVTYVPLCARLATVASLRSRRSTIRT